LLKEGVWIFVFVSSRVVSTRLHVQRKSTEDLFDLPRLAENLLKTDNLK